MAGLSDIMKYTATLTQYEEAKASGLVTDDVFVIILEDKVIKFQGYTIELGAAGGGSDIDISSLATKAEVIDNEEVTAAALHDHEDRIAELEVYVPTNYVTKDLLNITENNLIQEIIDNEEVTAEALHDHEDRIAELEVYVPTNYATKDLLTATKEELIQIIVDNEEVTAAALTDLDKRLKSYEIS